MLTNDDYSLVVLLATSSGSLDRSPKKNWVENSGGLPPYIRKLARAIERSGKPLSSAIAIAISRTKKWAAGGDNVDADTRAKSAKAIAQWEALKAKNKAGNIVKASYEDGSGYLMLSYIPSFNTNIVRRAWEVLDRQVRQMWEAEHSSNDSYGSEVVSSSIPYRYIKEVWTDFILVELEDVDVELWKVPFTVHPLTKEVTFQTPVAVKTIYVEMDSELSEVEKSLLPDFLN